MKSKSTVLFAFLITVAIACNQQDSKNHSGAGTDDSLPYDEKAACLLSEIAYCPKPQASLDKYMPGWKVKWESSAIGGNSAFVASDGKTMAVAIRGSLIEFSWEAFQNWIYQDLNVTSLEEWSYTNDSSEAKISEGASQGFRNLEKLVDRQSGSTLYQFLEANTTKKTPILITGHSLGGNLGTVYASWLWQHFKEKDIPRDNINIITFAAPAAGNESFADDFDAKFPHALRYENKNDIVPKFPCRSAIATLGTLFDTTLSAGKIEVGYKSATMSLDKLFGVLGTGMALLEFTTKNAVYRQPCGKGNVISIPLSGKNSGHDIANWLSEAGYQHGVARYAMQLGVPIVDCNQ